MKIRAVTGFLDPGWPLNGDEISTLASCVLAARDAFQEAGFEVQTLRLATPPPSKMTQPVPAAERPDLARQLEAECFLNEVDYIAIGPALPSEPDSYKIIPQMLGATETVFASGVFADHKNGISITAAQACAQVIQDASTITPDGFANLRFAGLANVPAGAPFFPAAYHDGGSPAIAVATESADLAVDIAMEADSLTDARHQLVRTIEDHANRLSHIASRIAAEHGVRFLGVDFSLSPFPEPGRSICTAIEALGVPAIGLGGTIAAAAFLTSCLDEATFQRTGFCGLFLPVLEDSILAARAAEGQLTINHLLMYTTLCGTGIDTIPLPGNVSPEAVASLLIDLGTIALRHNKPLTARLMPIPGKTTGDKIHFDFPYFADSRVMKLSAEPLNGILGNAETVHIVPHKT